MSIRSSIRWFAIAVVMSATPAPGLAQARDTDRDGIPDSLDRCVNAPETVNGHMDSDGCPDSVNTLFEFAKTSVAQFWTTEARSLNIAYAGPSNVTAYSTVI